MNPTFRVVPIASSLHDSRAVAELLRGFSARLAAAGGAVDHESPGEKPSLTVWFVLTGGTEQRLLDAIASHEQAAGAGPVLLLAHRGHNSLPAALETLARLQQDGRKGRVIYLDHAADEAGYARLTVAVHDVQAWHRLHQMRVGLVGAPSDWLVASMPSADAVRASWGPTVTAIPIEALHAKLDGAAGAEDLAQEIVQETSQTAEVSDEAVAEAARVARAVDDVVLEHKLDAVAVRCFDLVVARKTTGCLALARLNDRGVPAGCEGDLPSTMGMAWVRALLDAPSWMANPAGLDEEKNTLLLAHCTVPWGMVGEVRLRTHFESGLGVAFAGQFATGPVTLLRLGGTRLERVWICDAELIATGAAEGLCRTQATVRLRDARVAELLQHPLGNHLVMVRGHHGARLRAWWEAFGPG